MRPTIGARWWCSSTTWIGARRIPSSRCSMRYAFSPVASWTARSDSSSPTIPTASRRPLIRCWPQPLTHRTRRVRRHQVEPSWRGSSRFRLNFRDACARFLRLPAPGCTVAGDGWRIEIAGAARSQAEAHAQRQGQPWETKGRPDVPTQCGGRRHAVACRRPPHQPKRHSAVSSVRRRYSRSPTLNPRVRGSSPWRRTRDQGSDLAVLPRPEPFSCP